MDWNWVTYVVLATIVAQCVLNAVTTVANSWAMTTTIPSEFKDEYDQEAYAESQLSLIHI